jgi:hypothetical protein
MRKTVAAMAMSVMLLLATPSFAGVNNLVDGVNGIATAPLDVVAGLVEPHRYVDLGPANMVTDRIGGVVAGVLKAAERVVRGAVDVVTFPVTNLVKGGHSMDARFDLLGAADKK